VVDFFWGFFLGGGGGGGGGGKIELTSTPLFTNTTFVLVLFIKIILGVCSVDLLRFAC